MDPPGRSRGGKARTLEESLGHLGARAPCSTRDRGLFSPRPALVTGRSRGRSRRFGGGVHELHLAEVWREPASNEALREAALRSRAATARFGADGGGLFTARTARTLPTKECECRAHDCRPEHYLWGDKRLIPARRQRSNRAFSNSSSSVICAKSSRLGRLGACELVLVHADVAAEDGRLAINRASADACRYDC